MLVGQPGYERLRAVDDRRRGDADCGWLDAPVDRKPYTHAPVAHYHCRVASKKIGKVGETGTEDSGGHGA